MKLILLVLLLCVSIQLTGCAAPLVFMGGMATGAIIGDDRRSPKTMLQDEGIELNVRHALNNDPRLRDETNINITSFNGVCLLSGQAPTTIMRYQAETLVRKIAQVRLVYNEITISQPSSLITRSYDTIITARVKGTLFNKQSVHINRVKIVTESGVVFIMGMLTPAEADHATAVARSVSGVIKVVRLCELLE